MNGSSFIPKAGLRSTEFWIIILVLVLANVMPFVTQQYTGNETVQTVAEVVRGAVDILVSLGYLIARTVAKKNVGDQKGAVHLTTMLAIFLAFTVLICLFGCSVNEDWVRAAEATHKAIGPEYLEYVDADPALDKDEKALRHLTVTSWWRRIEEWKKTNQ